MSGLPTGWELTTIGDIADVQLGRQRSPKNHNGPYMRPYLRSANITWSGIDISDVKEMNFDPGDVSVFELQHGDLLLNEASGSPNEVGKPAIWRGEIEGCCFQNTLLRVRPREVSIAYLYWYCRAAALGGRFGEAGRGVNIRHLGKQGLAGFPVPLAPLAEQERIAGAIEDHLSRLGAAEAMLNLGLERLSSLERSALASTVDPKWPTLSLADACSVIVDCPHSTAKFVDSGVACIDTTNIRPFELVEDRLRCVSEQTYVERTRRLEPVEGDVIFAREGTVGTAVRVPPGARLCLGQRVMLLRAGPHVRADFLELVMNSHFVRRQYRPLILGTTAPHLNVRDVKALRIPVPPPAAQEAAALTARERRRSIERLRGELEQVQRRVAGLRRAVLTAAFAGRLVPQESGDESASVLLERIRTERTAAAPQRTRKVTAG
jgi:type I restriction enzyme S subunit